MTIESLNGGNLSSAKPTRRDFLYVATGAAAAVGAAATLVPLIVQMNPDAATLAAGGPIDLDVSKIQSGQQVAITWRGRPILVTNRTPQLLQTLQDPKLLSRL
ncbi:MAG: ubiquinol-cytochrome c reductase iron-sulfur subunit N-terminal domain-containing protein, partial [Bradyrhizobium sp.]